MRKLWWVLIPLALLLLGAVAWLLMRADPTPPPLPAGAVSGAGTGLLDGFSVPEGSVLLGPVLIAGQDGESPTEWLAVLAVTGDPLEVWRSYARQLADRYPAERIDPPSAPGCRAGRRDGFRCELRVGAADEATGQTEVSGAELLNAPDDVTGRYLIVVRVTRYPGLTGTDLYPEEPPRWRGGAPPVPRPARPPPKIGEPLAPSTTAYRGDDNRYVLLEGSEMLAQWGVGSLTGGFDVLLRVTPDVPVEEVASAYARQASQFKGEVQVTRYQSSDTGFVRYVPPGGAGGYQGNVWAVDRPGASDYVFYSLTND